jgi:hypothetical protein
MKLLKYIGMDVHMATTVIAVLDSTGKVTAEAIIETKTSAILDFVRSQRGTLHVTFEEGCQAAWLYDLIRPHVANVVVCDPRKIAKQGNKADRPDAKRLAELLRTNALTAVYHGEQSTKAVKELTAEHRAQVQNYLKATGFQLGLLVNFGHYPKLEIERIANTRGRTARIQEKDQ